LYSSLKTFVREKYSPRKNASQGICESTPEAGCIAALHLTIVYGGGDDYC
jgi:hypothetical protein